MDEKSVFGQKNLLNPILGIVSQKAIFFKAIVRFSKPQGECTASRLRGVVALSIKNRTATTGGRDG
jgi:hypothetical protein